MNNEQLHRDLGRVEGKLEAIQKDVAEMRGQLTEIGEYISQQRGSRRATLFISSGLASVVAFVVGIAVQMWHQ